MRVTILGSGSATGTPAVDRGWGKCDPDNPRNRRLRPSILVEEGLVEEGLVEEGLVEEGWSRTVQRRSSSIPRPTCASSC